METKRYARLKNLLLEKIVSGDYAPGDRFFSQNELMKKYGLSFSTVMRALEELVREGYLVRHQGKGTFVERVKHTPAAAAVIEGKRINLFATLPGPAGAEDASQIDVAAFFHKMQAAQTDGLDIRLTPVGRTSEDLEPYLFSRDPLDGAVCLYPAAAQLPALVSLAQDAPVIILDAAPPAASFQPLHAIVTDPAVCTQMAVDALAAYGHKYIGLVCNGQNSAYHAAAAAGFRHALRNTGNLYRESLVMATSASDPNGYHSTLALCDQNSDVVISAVIAAGSGVGVGASLAIQAMQPRPSSATGAAPPPHAPMLPMELVICDDPHAAPVQGYAVRRVGYGEADMARLCAEMLVAALRGKPMASLANASPQWLT